MISPDAFKMAMRHIAGGAAIITTRLDDKDYGLVVTSLSSLSVTPPTILACVGQAASAHDPLIASKRFCVNVMRYQDRSLAEKFINPIFRESRFLDSCWERYSDDILAVRSALVVLRCELTHAFPCNTHTIVAGLVTESHLSDMEAPPLVYYRGSYLPVPLPQVTQNNQAPCDRK